MGCEIRCETGDVAELEKRCRTTVVTLLALIELKAEGGEITLLRLVEHIEIKDRDRAEVVEDTETGSNGEEVNDVTNVAGELEELSNVGTLVVEVVEVGEVREVREVGEVVEVVKADVVVTLAEDLIEDLRTEVKCL